MATRVFKGPAVYGEAASTDTSSPSTGTGYRDTTITDAQIQAALRKFDTLAGSAIENEYLFRLSTLVDLIERTGVLGWNAETNYIASSFVVGDDGNIYRAVQANLNVDPTTDPGTNWLNYADISLTSSLDTLFPIGSILVGGSSTFVRFCTMYCGVLEGTTKLMSLNPSFLIDMFIPYTNLTTCKISGTDPYLT